MRADRGTRVLSTKPEEAGVGDAEVRPDQEAQGGPILFRAFSHKLHFWKLLSIQTHHCVTNSEKSPPKIMEMQRSPVGLADTLLLS